MNQVWEATGGCLQVQTVSLVMQAGCTTWVVAKWHISGGFGVNRVVGTHSRGVLLAQRECSVISELWAMVLSGAEQEF